MVLGHVQGLSRVPPDHPEGGAGGELYSEDLWWTRGNERRRQISAVVEWARLPELQLALSVQGPAGPILAGQQFVGLRAVGHMAGGAIVFYLPANPVGHHAEQHHLDNFAAVVEITGGLEVALAGVDPLPLEVAQRRKQL